MAKIGIAWAQYASGMEYSILELPDTNLPHLDSVYLNAFWKFLSDINGSLRTESDGVIPLPRLSDKYLMQEFIDSELYIPDELIHLDLCRRYLQALTLSDFTAPCGRRSSKFSCYEDRDHILSGARARTPGSNPSSKPSLPFFTKKLD